MDEQLTKRDVERMIDDKVRRLVSQFDILPDQIKARHVAEGVRFIRAGLAANRPTTAEKDGAVYFSTDTDTLNIWNGTGWVQEVLT